MAVPLSPSSDPVNKNIMVACNQASHCRLAENQREIQDLKEIVCHFGFIFHQEENNCGEGKDVIQSRLREKPALGPPQLEKLAPAELQKCHVNKARTRKRHRPRKKSRKQTQICHLNQHPRALLAQHDPDSHHTQGSLEPLVVHVRLEKHLVYKCSLAKEMTQMKGVCRDLICPSRISGCFPPQVEPELVPGLIVGEYCWCIVMKAKLVMQQRYPGGGWTVVLEEYWWCTRFGVYGNSLKDKVPHEAITGVCEDRSLPEEHHIMAFTHLADASYMWRAFWEDKLEILFQAWARVQQPLDQQSIHWIEAIEGYDTFSQKDEVVSADRAIIPRVCGDPPPLEGPDTIMPVLKEDGSYLLCGFWADEPEAPAQAWSEVVQCTTQQPIFCAKAIVVEDLSYKKEEGEVATADQIEPIPRACGDPPPLERPDVIVPILKDDRSYMLCAYWADESETPTQVSAEPWHLTTQQPICCAEAIVVEDASSQKEGEVASPDLAEANPRVGEDPPPLEGPDVIVPILKDDGSYMLCGFWADDDAEAPVWACAGAWHPTIQQPICCAEAIVVENPCRQKEEVELASTDQAEAILRVCGDPPPLEGPDAIVPILKDDGSYVLCAYWADEPEAPAQAWARAWLLTTQQPLCCAEAIVVEDSSNKKEKVEGESSDQAEAMSRVCGDPPLLEGPGVIVPILKDDGSYMLCGFWADEPEAPVQACAEPWHLTTQKPICCAEAIVVEEPSCKKEEGDSASAEQAEAIPRVGEDPPPLEGPDAIVPILKDDGSYMLCAYWADEPEAPVQAWAGAWHFTTQQPICCAENTLVEEPSFQEEEGVVAPADQAEANQSHCSASHLRVCEDPPPLEGPDVIMPILKDDGSYVLCAVWTDNPEMPVQAWAGAWHPTTQQPMCCAEAIVVKDATYQKEKVMLATADRAEAPSRVCGDPPPLEGPDAIVPILKDDGSYLLCGFWADEPEAPVQAWAGALHPTAQQPVCCAEAIVVEDASSQKKKIEAASAEQTEAIPRVCGDPPPLEGPDVIVPILKDDGSYVLCAYWADEPEAPVQACTGLWHPTTQQPICCAEAVLVEEPSSQEEEGKVARADQAEANQRVCGDPPPLEGPDVIVPILKDDGSYVLCAYWADESEAPAQVWAEAWNAKTQQPVCCAEAFVGAKNFLWWIS